jgi:uncharacterized RDD family membrane protein YckC
MTTGLTNHPTEVDPAIASQLHVAEAADTALTAHTATGAADPSFYPRETSIERTPDAWRAEVAARLERYRTRRKPRTPRYPSLLLSFDAPASWSRPTPLSGSQESGSTSAATAPGRAGQEFALRTDDEQAPEGGDEDRSYLYSKAAADQSAKVIEFPRSAAIPVFNGSELADPIFERPRIVEAPEILPPPPALGGMLMEPTPREAVGRRDAADYAVASVSIARRGMAMLVDGVVVTIALAGFSAVFIRLNQNLNLMMATLPLLAGVLSAGAVLLWAAYQFLFVVYTGSTPGLRAGRLQLAAFDGSDLNRRQRRWRVLASFLSAFSAGLGYLWCVLDEKGLCWHDRITHTHVKSDIRA